MKSLLVLLDGLLAFIDFFFQVNNSFLVISLEKADIGDIFIFDELDFLLKISSLGQLFFHMVSLNIFLRLRDLHHIDLAFLVLEHLLKNLIVLVNFLDGYRGCVCDQLLLGLHIFIFFMSYFDFFSQALVIFFEMIYLS